MADVSNANYDRRREARGTEPPPRISVWKGRAAFIGGILVILILCGGGLALWWHHARVRTISARVQAAVVSLSPVVDAKLLELRVGEGDHVAEGQLLARLDETELGATLEAAQANLAIKRSLHAEARARHLLTRSQVEADIERAGAKTQIAVENVAQARAEVTARRAKLAGEIEAARARCGEMRARLDQLERGPRQEVIQSAEADFEAARAMLSLYRLELEQSRKLATEGIDSQHLLEVKRTQVTTQEKAVRSAELAWQRLRSGPTEEEIKVAEEMLAEREAELSLAELGEHDIALLESVLAVRAAELREARALETKAEGRSAEVAVAEAAADAAEAEMRQAEAEVKGCRAALANRDFISPVEGTVIRTFVRMGEVCRKGVPALLVGDDSVPRWIEGFVREEDAMLVDVGQPAWVRVPAASGPKVDAVVEQIGLHADSGDEGGGAVTTYPRRGRVWVRIRPLAPLDGHPVTGTSAGVVIRVRGGRQAGEEKP